METPELGDGANISDVNVPESISQSNFQGFSHNNNSNLHQEFMREYRTLSDAERQQLPFLDTVLDFRNLSKLYIRYLERHLLEAAKLIHEPNNPNVLPAQIFQVGRLLHMHARAVQDLELMNQRVSRELIEGACFYDTVSSQILVECGEDLPRAADFAEFKINWRLIKDEPTTFEEVYKRTRREQLLSKVKLLGIACAGGIAFIGPMLIMTLHKSLATSLVTTSIATFLVGILLVGLGRAKESELLAIVSAYAAVMVVFVGSYV